MSLRINTNPPATADKTVPIAAPSNTTTVVSAPVQPPADTVNFNNKTGIQPMVKITKYRDGSETTEKTTKHRDGSETTEKTTKYRDGSKITEKSIKDKNGNLTDVNSEKYNNKKQLTSTEHYFVIDTLCGIRKYRTNSDYKYSGNGNLKEAHHVRECNGNVYEEELSKYNGKHNDIENYESREYTSYNDDGSKYVSKYNANQDLIEEKCYPAPSTAIVRAK